jgi:hypothetical protein
VGVTIEVAKWFVRRGDVQSVADLSCGDAAIARALGIDDMTLGDYAPRYSLRGPIEETIEQIGEVDLFICSETLEHLNEPGQVLKQIRQKARFLVLSTPVDRFDDANPEHYWAWDRQGVEEMMTAAGFDVDIYCPVDTRPAGLYYCFGVWAAR